ncbi:MAG: glycosyltransferase [Lachnospiraceae bacterium]|nr:glycosyltransferase [Lachnospiraceae bacterium]
MGLNIVFMSNFINHHQKPFCDAMYDKVGEGFIFLQTEPMDQERIEMGWSDAYTSLPYVRLLYENEEEAKRMVMEADVLIAGWSDRTDLIKARLNEKKMTIRISERIYREGQWKFISPLGLISKYAEHVRYRKAPAYLLCAGAYVASDFKLIHAYPDKMYKFGYFPELRKYHIDKLFELKDKSGMIEIVFAGRFLKLKHPEYICWLARDLKKENEKRRSRNEPLLPEFRIHMIGSGELEHPMRTMITEYELLDNVQFYGFLPPDKVRTIMERCHIMIFPSDELEGWGAVVNEAMNSGCAVVACLAAGAVPYLIRQWDNGVAFDKEDYDSMKDAVIYLMTHGKQREEIGKRAYRTILDSWNPENAAGMLLYMIEGWQQGLDHAPIDGPMSKAPVIAPGKMRAYMENNGKRRGS